MQDLLVAIERLGPVAALRSSFVAYPLVNAAHVLAIGALVTTTILMDLRILGAFAIERAAFVSLMRRVAVGAFALAVLTGLALFSIRASEYAPNPAFQAKLALLAAAGANLAIFSRYATPGPDEAYPAAARMSAAASIALWTGVLVAGRFIGFV